MSDEEPKAFVSPLIHIHVKFANGSLDGPFLVDLMNMSEDEDDALAAWLSDLSQGKTHLGRNKPSWLWNQDGSPKPGTYSGMKSGITTADQHSGRMTWQPQPQRAYPTTRTA